MSNSPRESLLPLEISEEVLVPRKVAIEEACVGTLDEICDPCDASFEESSPKKSLKRAANLLLCVPCCLFKPAQALYRVHQVNKKYDLAEAEAPPRQTMS